MDTQKVSMARFYFKSTGYLGQGLILGMQNLAPDSVRVSLGVSKDFFEAQFSVLHLFIYSLNGFVNAVLADNVRIPLKNL